MIYIQKAEGLQQVSPSLTKEKIIAALGYTPADNATFFEDESGSLLVADSAGYVVARIDKDGIHTTRLMADAVSLGDEDLASKLASLQASIDSIDVGDIDLSNYYTKSEVDAAIDGVVHPTTDLSNYYNKTEVDEAIAAAADGGEVDLSGYALAADVEANKVITDAHEANAEVHITAEERTTWNAKSDFDGDFNSLSNAPHIVNDNEDEMVVCDSQGNVIFRATAAGINVAAIYVNGVQVNNELPEITADLEGAVLKIVDGKASWVLEA